MLISRRRERRTLVQMLRLAPLCSDLVGPMRARIPRTPIRSLAELRLLQYGNLSTRARPCSQTPPPAPISARRQRTRPRIHSACARLSANDNHTATTGTAKNYCNILAYQSHQLGPRNKAERAQPSCCTRYAHCGWHASTCLRTRFHESSHSTKAPTVHVHDRPVNFCFSACMINKASKVEYKASVCLFIKPYILYI